MPASTRRALAAIRAHHTGETHAQAATAIRGHDHGLDTCTPEQLALRSQLALRWFNDGKRGDLERLRSSDVIVSAQYDRLVMHHDDPTYIVRQIVRTDLVWGITYPSPRRVLMREATTDGLLELHCTCPDRQALSRWIDHEAASSEQERRGRHWVPYDPTPTTATPDAQVLLAALLVRHDMAPAHLKSRPAWRFSWCLDSAFRADPAWPDHVKGMKRVIRLDGDGDHWRLTWDADPLPSTVLAALDHPELGVTGLHEQLTVVTEPDLTHTINLARGTASLTLHWLGLGQEIDPVTLCYRPCPPVHLDAGGRRLDRNQARR